jgi:hypothetical protein
MGLSSCYQAVDAFCSHHVAIYTEDYELPEQQLLIQNYVPCGDSRNFNTSQQSLDPSTQGPEWESTEAEAQNSSTGGDYERCLRAHQKIRACLHSTCSYRHN